jgi:hypothetical protein
MWLRYLSSDVGKAGAGLQMPGPPPPESVGLSGDFVQLPLVTCHQ